MLSCIFFLCVNFFGDVMKRLFPIFCVVLLAEPIIAAEDSQIAIPGWVIREYDSSSAITWYKTPPADSQYGNTFSLSIGQRNGSPPWLVLRIAYTYSWERDILLVFKFTVTADGSVYTIRTGFNSVNRTMNYLQKNYSEWYDNYIYPELMTVVEKVAAAKTVKIGFHGINGYAERIVEDTEKEQLKSMISIYKTLGGK